MKARNIPELVSEEKLDEIAREAASLPGGPLAGMDMPMREAYNIALDAARAALKELGVAHLIEVDRSTCQDSKGLRCPWWDADIQGCRFTQECAFTKGAVFERLKK